MRIVRVYDSPLSNQSFWSTTRIFAVLRWYRCYLEPHLRAFILLPLSIWNCCGFLNAGVKANWAKMFQKSVSFLGDKMSFGILPVLKCQKHTFLQGKTFSNSPFSVAPIVDIGRTDPPFQEQQLMIPVFLWNIGIHCHWSEFFLEIWTSSLYCNIRIFIFLQTRNFPKMFIVCQEKF